MGSAHIVSASPDVAAIRHMASRVRARGVGVHSSCSLPLLQQSELLAREVLPAESELLDDRHLFLRVELIVRKRGKPATQQ